MYLLPVCAWVLRCLKQMESVADTPTLNDLFVFLVLRLLSFSSFGR